MAPLNPTIQPTNDPNFRGYSQAVNPPDTIKPQGVQTNSIMPIGQQIGDRSAEYEGKSAEYKMAADSTDQKAYGDLFKNITEMGAFVGKAGVAVVKKDIEDKVYDIADRERQQYTDALEKMKASGQVTGILAADSDSKTSPQEIQDLGDHLSTLQSAKDGGKISSTYYESRLLSEAKKLRAQYPGFRQEIDEQFAKVTGSNPANAYIRALTSDINRNATSASSQIKAAQSFVLQRNEYPGAQQMLQDIQTGKAGLQEATQWAAPYDQQTYALKQQSQVLQLGKQTREEQQLAVGALFDKASGIAVGRIVDAQAVRMGLNSAEDASRLQTNIQSGVVPTQQIVQWGNDLKQQETVLRLTMNRDAQKSGAVQILGQDAVNKKIEDAVKPLKDMQDLLYARDVGTFYTSKQTITAMNDDAQKALLQHPKLGPQALVFNALRQQVGDPNLQKFSLDLINGDYPQNLKSFVKDWTSNFATQYNMKTSGVPVTFNDAIEKIQSTKELNNKRMNSALMNEVTRITDGNLDDKTRMNYAIAAFSPQNRGMISKLSADGVDSQGRPITGQAAIFQKFTSPEMTKSMWELGQKNPSAWTNYVNWTQETIANDLANQDIHTLGQISNPAIKVGWDSDNKRLVAKYDERPSVITQGHSGLTAGGVSSPGRAGTDSDYLNVQRVVNKMNGYLGNYKNVAEAAGIPVDAFLIKTIAQVDPEAVQNMQGIPGGILRDLGMAQLKAAGPR